MYITKFRFNTDNLQALWEAYLLGTFHYMGKGKTRREFFTQFAQDMSDYTSFHVIGTGQNLIAFIFAKYEGEILEPHVEFYANQTARDKVTAYKFFIEHVKKDVTIKACLIRSFRNTKGVFDHFVKKGLIEFFQTTRLGVNVEYQYLIK